MQPAADGSPQVSPSALYTFVDRSRRFALHFLEGQGLIHDLALLHELRGEGFACFRDAVLSVQPMIALLKRGEQFGFYLDSEEPAFLLKIEAAHHGDTRCLLLPQDFREFPERVRGVARLQKVFDNRPPYESVLRIDGLPLGRIVDRVLRDSYQVRAALLVSAESDQSALLLELPPLDGAEESEAAREAMAARREAIAAGLDGIFARALGDEAEIVAALGALEFELLARRPVRLRCNCSRERTVQQLRLLSEADREGLFDPGQEFLEVICEYCKTRYRVSRGDLAQPPTPPH